MMAMNFKCGVPKLFKSVRYMLLLVNGLSLLTGLILLFIGLTAFIRYSQYEDLITNRYSNIAGFVIATGVIIILGSSLGWYSAVSRDFRYIAAYVVFLVVVLVFEIALTIVGFSLSSDAASEIRSTMVHSLNMYSSKIEISALWDNLQRAFECCGVIGRFDWTPSSQIPVSCCYIDFGTISPFTCGIENSYATGCAEALGDYLQDQAYIIAIGGLVITCFQVPLIGLSVYAGWRSRSDEIELES